MRLLPTAGCELEVVEMADVVDDQGARSRCGTGGGAIFPRYRIIDLVLRSHPHRVLLGCSYRAPGAAAACLPPLPRASATCSSNTAAADPIDA